MNIHIKLTTEESIAGIQQRLKFIEKKATLSTLWIFVLLNMIFRDIHEIVLPRFMEEMQAQAALISDELMLIGGIMVEILIVMVLLSRVLPYRFNRPANIIAALFAMATLVANGVNDLDDMWFMAIEVIGLLAIIWLAWNWKKQETPALSTA